MAECGHYTDPAPRWQGDAMNCKIGRLECKNGDYTGQGIG